MTEDQELRIGEHAVEQGLIAPEALQECLQAQRTMAEIGMPERLDVILMKKGYLSEEQVKEIIAALGIEKGPRRLGGYEVHEKLGEGSMGAVFRARHINTDRPVAFKILRPALAKRNHRRHDPAAESLLEPARVEEPL